MITLLDIRMAINLLIAVALHGFLIDVCNGCEAGLYYENRECKRCPTKCFSCLSVTNCTLCEIGHYGETCNLSCSLNCHDNECNKTTGVCLSCKKGYFMDPRGSCTQCPNNCTTCTSNTYCFACKNGYKGEFCKDLCSSCEKDSRCDKNTGYCLDSCRRGFSGELCNIMCNSKCISCGRLNQDECSLCAHNRYGLNCNEICSLTCLDNACHDDGVCTDGCVNGYWGEMCNNTCSTYCKDNVCNIVNGKCLKGKLDTNPEDSSSAASNLGVAFCVILIAAVLVSIVLIIYLRRKHPTLQIKCWNDKHASRIQYQYLLGLCRIDIVEDVEMPSPEIPETGCNLITEQCVDAERRRNLQLETDKTGNQLDGHSQTEETENESDTSLYVDAPSDLSTSHAIAT